MREFDQMDLIILALNGLVREVQNDQLLGINCTNQPDAALIKCCISGLNLALLRDDF